MNLLQRPDGFYKIKNWTHQYTWTPYKVRLSSNSTYKYYRTPEKVYLQYKVIFFNCLYIKNFS